MLVNDRGMTAPLRPDPKRIKLVVERLAEFLARRPAALEASPNGIPRNEWLDEASGKVHFPSALAASACSWRDPLARDVASFLSEALDALRVAERPEKYVRYRGAQSKKAVAGAPESISLNEHPGLVFDDSETEAHLLMQEARRKVGTARRIYAEVAVVQRGLLRDFHDVMKSKARTFLNVILADQAHAALASFERLPSERWTRKEWGGLETKLARTLQHHRMTVKDIAEFLMRPDEDPANAVRRIRRNLKRG